MTTTGRKTRNRMSIAQRAQQMAEQSAAYVIGSVSALPSDRRADALKTILQSFGLERAVTANTVQAGRRGFGVSDALQVGLAEAIQRAMLRMVTAAGNPGLGTNGDVMVFTPEEVGIETGGRYSNAIELMEGVTDLITRGTDAAMSIYEGVTSVRDARDRSRIELERIQAQSRLSELEARAQAATAAAEAARAPIAPAVAPSLVGRREIPWGTIALVAGGVLLVGGAAHFLGKKK
jgi:hypothetical protein